MVDDKQSQLTTKEQGKQEDGVGPAGALVACSHGQLLARCLLGPSYSPALCGAVGLWLKAGLDVLLPPSSLGAQESLQWGSMQGVSLEACEASCHPPHTQGPGTRRPE